MSARYAQVLFPVNVPEPFDYRVPDGMAVSPGDFVFAPIGQQFKLGVVWGLRADDIGRPLKDIAEKKITRSLHPDLIKFVNWVAK